VTVLTDLPPLTGSPIFDPWRIRLRLELAGELRRPEREQRQTPTERTLWALLEHEPPGWLREYSTGVFRLDFYCPDLRLAVEVDGGSHFGREGFERDALRDEWHGLRGIRTKRFSVGEVERDPAWVLGEIRRLTQSELAQPERAPAPPRAAEECPAATAPPEAMLRHVADGLIEAGALGATLQQASLRGAWGDSRSAEELVAQACRTVLPAAQQRTLKQLLALLDF
jgi:very-short-patch-repair endonuclease